MLYWWDKSRYGHKTEEHLADIRNNRDKKSPIAAHMSSLGHQLDTTSAKITQKESREYHRKFKESLHVRGNVGTMNTSKGMKINSIWTSTLVSLYKNHKWWTQVFLEWIPCKLFWKLLMFVKLRPNLWLIFDCMPDDVTSCVTKACIVK